MFWRAIWNKLHERIFEKFVIAEVKQWAILNFQKLWGWFIPQNVLNETYDYWLMTQNQQTFCIEVNIF